jgi:TRAP-type transport system small permease protein
MERTLETWRRALALVAVAERVLGVLLIGNIILNIAAQVFSRYVLNRPLVWVEELATYSFIWATFIGASLGLKRLRHVRIETYVARLGRNGQASSCCCRRPGR